MVESYCVLRKTGKALLKEKGSKFYAYAFGLGSQEEFKDKLSEIKKEHSKARHWCWAIRLDAEKPLERSNDDGEPSGSAGIPILNSLRSSELFNTGVIVVRYFGGSLLGVRGLIDAYSGSAKMAIENAGIELKTLKASIEVEFPYELMSAFQRTTHKKDIDIVKEHYGEHCIFTLEIPKSQIDSIAEALQKIYGLKLTILSS